MGLDMYLSAKRYVWSYDGKDKELQDKLNDALGELPDGMRADEVRVSAMYWRKANAIHNWFVENCQDGEDNCQEFYVSREQIQELRDLCQQALDNPDEADELLPTVNGFFFGSTEIDQYYFDGLRESIEGLDRVLSLPDSYEFYYRASW